MKQLLYDANDVVLIPCKVCRIDVNGKSEVTYKLRCDALNANRKEQSYELFCDESFINSKLDIPIVEPDVPIDNSNSESDMKGGYDIYGS